MWESSHKFQISQFGVQSPQAGECHVAPAPSELLNVTTSHKEAPQPRKCRKSIALLFDILWPVGPLLWGTLFGQHAEHAEIHLWWFQIRGPTTEKARLVTVDT